jgi:16S rRNA (cytosine967-C5)-methyltransferase
LGLADHHPKAAITAIELHPHRARLLQERLRPHAPQVQVVVADVRDLPLLSKFDLVLADVPCSGTGTLARNPEIKWRLSLDDLAQLPKRQLAILRSAQAQVASGGRLIYSTCSLEKEENENVIEQALAEDSSFRLLDCRMELDSLRTVGELTWPDPASLLRGPYLRTIPRVVGLNRC